MSQMDWVTCLSRKLPASFISGITCSTTDESGAVMGSRDALHESQAYPEEYGVAVSSEWLRARASDEPPKGALLNNIEDVSRARLHEVKDFMGV